MEKPAAEARVPQLPSWALPAALVLLVLALVLVLARLAPPDPAPATAPAAQFSAGRAHALLAALAGDGSPHPSGSPADSRVREVLLAELRRIGYAPRVEESFVCNHGGCSTVRNVLAELPGREPGAVLLLAHYDSVGAGPGVSDDLTGTAAVVEVARALKAGPPPRHPVLFLLDEGEESGLLGAEAFVASPEAARVRAAVNLEARGTSGPSLMFETSRDNAWLIPLLDGVAQPVASSLFQTIYEELLTNDTDFTVLKRRGIAGFNFAFIGDPARYHTARDDLAHASPASLQHHGDNALAAVRALAGSDLPVPPPRGRAVFFDLLGGALFSWPASWSLALGVVALVLVVIDLVLLFRRRLLTGGALAWGLAAWLGTLLVTLLLTYLIVFLLQLAGGLRTPWPARSVPPQAAAWLLALAVAGFLALRRAGLFGLWAGVWLGWAVLGLVLALLAPGVSYLFLVPAMIAGVAGLCGLALLTGPAGRAMAAILPSLAAALLWLPLLLLIYLGLGLPLLWLIAALAAILATTLLPALGGSHGGWRWGVASLAALAALVMLIGIVASPPFAPGSPQRMNLAFHQDADTHRARLMVLAPPPLPPAMRKAADFKPEAAFPWTAPLRIQVADAPALAVQGPQLTLVESAAQGASRRLRFRVTSPRGASTVILQIPPTALLQRLAVEGREVPGAGQWKALGANGWSRYELTGLPPAGYEVTMVLGAGPQEIYLLDRTPGLPPAGAALVKARPESAAPAQDGDTTLVSRKVRL